MSSSSLQNKTIRPGSLNGYSFYNSNRRPTATQTLSKPKTPKARSRRGVIFVSLFILIAGFWLGLRGSNEVPNSSNNTKSSQAAVLSSVNATTAQLGSSNYCADNDIDKTIIVSIEKRHLWACENDKTVHQAPVITGLQNHPETETPLGSYKIYAKQTNTTLKGTDNRGSWSYGVYYWMPFLDNQYGTYGFHDATWRDNKEFGNVSPDSDKASHGCVELPLSDQKWLFEWAPVHTPVTVQT